MKRAAYEKRRVEIGRSDGLILNFGVVASLQFLSGAAPRSQYPWLLDYLVGFLVIVFQDRACLLENGVDLLSTEGF